MVSLLVSQFHKCKTKRDVKPPLKASLIAVGTVSLSETYDVKLITR